MRKRWLILITVIAVPIFGIVLLRSYYQVKFNRRVEALAKQGFPVSREEVIARYALPEGVENAAHTYIEAFKYYQEPNETEKTHLPLFGDYTIPQDCSPLPQDIMDAIESTLDANKKTLELLDEAAKIEHSLFPRDHISETYASSSLAELKKSAWLLYLRNLHLAEKGRVGELYEAFSALLKLPSTLNNQACLIDELVAIAIKALAAENLERTLNLVHFSDEQVLSLQKQFSKTQDPKRFRTTLINERAGATIEFLRTPFGDRGITSEWILQRKLENITGLEQYAGVLLLEYLERYIDASKLPTHERTEVFNDIALEAYNRKSSLFFTASPAVYATIGDVDLRVLGILRCAETALAIERYRLKHQSLPESLEELVPEFMKAVPVDPFDGEPLRYIRLENGYTVYTIGCDWVDNGGLSKEQVKEKTGEESPEEYDWPFTIRR